MESEAWATAIREVEDEVVKAVRNYPGGGDMTALIPRYGNSSSQLHRFFDRLALPKYLEVPLSVRPQIRKLDTSDGESWTTWKRWLLNAGYALSNEADMTIGGLVRPAPVGAVGVVLARGEELLKDGSLNWAGKTGIFSLASGFGLQPLSPQAGLELALQDLDLGEVIQVATHGEALLKIYGGDKKRLEVWRGSEVDLALNRLYAFLRT